MKLAVFLEGFPGSLNSEQAFNGFLGGVLKGGEPFFGFYSFARRLAVQEGFVEYGIHTFLSLNFTGLFYILTLLFAPLKISLQFSLFLFLFYRFL